LKQVSPGTIALVAAAPASLEASLQAFGAGADDFVIKPVDGATLRTSVAKARHWRAQIDNLRSLNSELLKLREERTTGLPESDRLRDEFMAAASHDLKNAVTLIKGFSEVLLRRVRESVPDLQGLTEGLEIIDRQAEAIRLLADQLLDSSRIEAGSLDLQIDECDLRDCIAAVLGVLSPEERERVVLELPDAWLTGKWDRTRLEQVLLNLVGNALKFSPESEPVSVKVERRTQEIEVAVTDRGMGVPPEELPRLFQRFYRTAEARSSGVQGTGLGLYICSGIIVAHGGRLWVESAGEGQGATFRFTLPLTA